MSTTPNLRDAQQTYRDNRAREAAAFADLGRRVAEALTVSSGTVWAYCQPDDFDAGIYQHIEIAGPDAQRLHIRRSHNNRLEVYADFGDARDFRPRGEHHEITVSATRRPVEIAREIMRRLLPAYAPSLANARAAQAAWDTQKAHQDALAAELCTLASGTYAHQTTTRFYVSSTVGHAQRRMSTEVDVSSDLSITLTARNLTAEQARSIIAIVTMPAAQE